MTVTQTEVESLRRMDVSVRPADRPDGEALATVTGFYGTAIGAVGGSTLPWADGQPATDDGAEDGGDEEGNNQANDRPQRQPDADEGSFTERVRRDRQPPAEEE
jgi:hypothetical protein